MGIKKRSHIGFEEARSSYQHLIEMLYPLMKPYFNISGKVDLSKNDPSVDISGIMARILDAKIAIEDNAVAKYFCADDVMAHQIIVEDDFLMKFWGIIYWLQMPHDYEVNKTGRDPFYCEFRINNDILEVGKMKCGDYDKTNLDRVWWYDLQLNWIYEF